MVRITTNGVLRTYKSGLMNSSNALNDARNAVLTQRNFNSYAEDPASATQAFQLRRSYYRVSSQITNNTSVINKFQSAWTSLDTVISDLGDASGKVSALKGLNDATAAGRQALGSVLSQTAESIVQNMNVKYGDSFVFSGADGLNIPFSFDETTGNLLYRGVNVNAGSVAKPDTTEPADGDPIPDEWQAYYDDQADLQKLNAMAAETSYVDIGLGLQEDGTGSLISSSAFNASITGIDMLGYGVDEDGDSKNIVSIMQQIGTIFSRCDADTGDFASDADEETATRLTEKLEAALSNITTKYTELDTKSTFLESNSERLESTSDTLNEEILSIEQCDLASAITSFSWAQYCYNAALKVGNSILSESLMDYLT